MHGLLHFGRVYLPPAPRVGFAFSSFLIGWFCAIVLPSAACAADFNEARQQYYAGNYEQCIALTRTEVDKGIWNDFWSRQLITCLLTVGEYEQAKEVYEQVERKFSSSIALRRLGAEAYRHCGDWAKGDKLLDEIPEMVRNAPWRFSDRENLIAIGRYLVGEGEDAREILETFYDRVLKSDAQYAEAHIAIAELALSKADYQEAARSLATALELRPKDPHIHYLLSQAWAPSDPEAATKYLKSALDCNPYHVESLLLHARQLIDQERYAAAEAVLDEVFDVNQFQPGAWALKAAIAHLRGEYKNEGAFRSKALERWIMNPAVDHQIGKVLSKHYRFDESVQYQRRSLKLDPQFMPAKFQLAQDLLRTGRDEEGWMIVDQVSAEDKYNVVAYNLKTLQAQLAKFTTLQTPDFLVRMERQEAEIYGEEVLRLLNEAKSELVSKYDVELNGIVTVEIFPQQSDFAIRTFGLPGGAGFLGVCFGSLITANSPASQGDAPSNWKSVLWHEFCHVVTLQKTKNRMPRWLSEGISVYEELKRDPSWGQSMTPIYKSMLLGDDFVPLSQLSSAFLNPASPMHLQFAYFESALAVEYLEEVHGSELMLQLLVDLGMGVTINDAFERRYGNLEKLDADFRSFVMEKANGFLADTDFATDEIPEKISLEGLQSWVNDHPDNYPARQKLISAWVQTGDYETALVHAQALAELYPNDNQPGGALQIIADLAQKLDDGALEYATRSQLVRAASDNVPSMLRMIELAEKSENWQDLAEFSQKLISVQPLIPDGHEGIIKAARETNRPHELLRPLNALKQMDPLDPAGLHFELAEALFAEQQYQDARREALWALEFTPRYREAQRLLLKIHEALTNPPQDSSALPLPVEPPEAGKPPSPST